VCSGEMEDDDNDEIDEGDEDSIVDDSEHDVIFIVKIRFHIWSHSSSVNVVTGLRT